MKIKLNNCQERFWLDSSLHPDDSNNIGLIFRMRGRFDVQLFRQAIYRVVSEIEVFHSVCEEGPEGVFLNTETDTPLVIEFFEEAVKEKYEVLLEEFGKRLFDLKQELPLRFLIIQVSDEQYLLEMAFHHICIDAVSFPDFSERLSIVYRAWAEYKEVPRWQKPLLQDYFIREKDHQVLKEKGIQYWQHFFEDMPKSIDFAGTKKGKSGCMEFKFSKQLNQSIERLSIQLQISPFRIFMAAWLWILSGYSGNRKVVVSYAVNIRPKEFKDLIGPFVNNLSYGGDLSGNPTFRETLEDCRRQRREVRDFQEVLITDIVGHLREEKILQSDEPFLNVVINYANWGHLQKLDFVGIQTEFYRRVMIKQPFDLIFEVEPGKEGTCRLVYGDRFSKNFIQSMQRSFVRLLGKACQKPAIHFSQFSFITGREFVKLNDQIKESIRRQDEEFVDFLTCFRRTVAMCKDKPAVYFGEAETTYRELDLWSDYIARVIEIKYFDRKGCHLSGFVPIGFCWGENDHRIAVILGIMKAGATYVPLDPSLPGDRLAFMIEDCGIGLVVTTKEHAGKIKGVEKLLLEDVPQDAQVAVAEKKIIDSEDYAYIIYTSGTTGQPKGVSVTYGNLAALISNAVRYFQLGTKSVQLQYANLGFDASVMEIFPALVKGAAICIATDEERRNPEQLAALIQKRKVDTAYIAPVMLAQLKEKLPGLRTLVVGGEMVPTEVLRRWGKNRRLLNAYGPTETTVFVTINVMHEKSYANDIGKVVEGTYAYVVDEFGRLLPEEVPGELWIGGCQLVPGYIGRPELTSKKFITNPFVPRRTRTNKLYRTGDLVMRSSNGHFFFRGRIDDQVKIRGFRIEPGEIESCLSKIEGINQALVVVNEEHDLKRLVAYIQSTEPDRVDQKKIREELGLHLPAYMVPSAFVVLREFPQTLSGKIDRKKLPQPEWREREYVAPVTEKEKQLAVIAGKILSAGAVSVEDDLFAIGLSSITTVNMVAEAEKVGIKISVSAVYREKTIRRVAAVAENSIYHWYGTENNEKPLIVLVCGHMDFGSMLIQLAEPLSSRYAILVIESYHDYPEVLSEGVTFSELIELYVRILTEILPSETKVYAFVGHCLGGEMAYALAALWTKVRKESPKVWMFNSLAKRTVSSEGMQMEHLQTALQTVLWKVAKKKKKLTDRLVASEMLPKFQGEVKLFLPRYFTAHLSGPELPAWRDQKMLRNLKDLYAKNPEDWRSIASKITICQVEGDHWTMLREVDKWL